MYKSTPKTGKLCLSLKNSIVLIVICLVSQLLNAQTYNPRSYWTFDNATSSLKDEMNLFNLDPNYYSSGYTINNNTAGVGVGKYLTLGSTSTYIRGGQLPTDSAFTIEFLFRPGYKFNYTKFFYKMDGSVTVRMGYPYFLFSTTIKNSSGSYVTDDFRVDLNQIGRKSYGYYMDGNWHHFVFKYNSNTGLKEIWIDGQLPAGFSKVTSTGYFDNTVSTNKDLMINTSNFYEKYYGDYDEFATYTYSLPANMIYKHYLEFINHGHYSFGYTATAPPAPATVTSGLNMDEFPPGHPAVNVSTIDQLKTFPLPRYKTGHTLLPNFNWMNPMILGSRFQSGVTDAVAVTNSVTVQTELAKNYNYMLQVNWTSDQFNDAYITLANQNPQWKLSLITFRAQLSGGKIVSQSLPNDHYLQNSSGQFLSLSGSVTTNKTWRPTAPISSYTADGQAVKSMISSALVNRLTRPVDFINENGEVFPLITNTAMALDPQVTAAKNVSGLDWDNFLSSKYKENQTQAYRDQFMSLPLLSNAKFTEYRIDGHRLWQFRYEQSRYINTPINGQYYSTADFYVRWPSNWRNWSGPWHGWQWIVDSRYYELALGDKLYSPCVAAGWDANPENDVRPAQWLGLLKCLSMTGAEFFYTGYFNDQPSYNPPNPPPNDPKGYIWQAVLPSYAQAVSSRYEDYLRNGTLLGGDVPNDYINPVFNAFNFWTGDLRKLVVIRKLNSGNKYAITGTIQPNSSMIGNAELESVATITLDGQTLKFKVRRQGSTYMYDNSNTLSPVFYQLDEWHENKHPYSWTKDFNIEGELFDNTNTNAIIKTQVPAGTAAGDFTNATSYVSFNTVSDVIYNFQPRGLTTSNYYLWVRVRSKDGTSTGFTATLDGTNTQQFGCITDTNWVWYRFNQSNIAVVYSNLSLAPHQLKITPSSTKLEIDKVSIITNSGAFYGNTTSPCSSTATITPNGPTTFCQGGSVILSANTGTSYLWSGNQTTQSITVTTSGTYTVTVYSGASSAISSPVTVTVNSNPAATITAGGATTFCSGGSVTLTSSSGSGYLWSPGNQTTQSITLGSSGNYTVRVTNTSGCSATSAPKTVTVNSLPTATITPSGSLNINQGSSVTLTSSVGSSYYWLPGGQTTQSKIVNTAGSYTVRVTNSSGCSATSAPAIVTIIGANATITPSGPTTFCQGGSVILSANTGTSYLWSGNQTTQSITVTTSGTYTVTVYSGVSSAISSPVIVTVNSNPIATISPSGPTIICQGGSVTFTSSSGSGYLWSPGNQTTQSITLGSSGSYTVRVTNISGCSATSAAKTVTVNSLPIATITAGGATTFCQGVSVTLTSSSGSAYLWTPSGQTTQSVNINSSGSYFVRVTNSSGCSATSSSTSVTVNNCSCPIPTGLFASNIHATYADLNWNTVSGVDSLQVQMINVGNGYVYTTGMFRGWLNQISVGLAPNTVYNWKIRSKCGSTITSWSAISVFTTPTVRMANPGEILSIENQIIVYPNPTSDETVLSFISPNSSTATIDLMDFTGKVIRNINLEAIPGSNEYTLNMKNYPKGVYLIMLNINGVINSKKIVVI